MCVRTHVLFNSYLMYVNHFNTFLMSEACLGAYTLLYMHLHYICIFIIYASSLMNTAMVLRRR